MSYDSPNFAVRNEHLAGEAGGAATTEYAKFRHFQKMRVKAVHSYVTVAGTTTDHAFNLFHGTTSVGAFAHGTATAGSLLTAQTDIDVASGVQLSVKSLADAVGKAHIIYEFENAPDGVVSA
jgi:hypothetical protein